MTTSHPMRCFAAFVLCVLYGPFVAAAYGLLLFWDLYQNFVLSGIDGFFPWQQDIRLMKGPVE